MTHFPFATHPLSLAIIALITSDICSKLNKILDIASDKFINDISHSIDMQVLEESSFRRKAITALGISVVADALDYLAVSVVRPPSYRRCI